MAVFFTRRKRFEAMKAADTVVHIFQMGDQDIFPMERPAAEDTGELRGEVRLLVIV